MKKQTNEGRELARMLCGDINRVLLNGEEIRSITYKTLRSISAVLLTHSKDPDGNSEEDARIQRALIMLHTCLLCDLGLYSEETEEQMMNILAGFDIVSGVPHRINTGNPEIDEFVNAGMDELEAEGEL